MKIQFEENQDHQTKAIQSTISVFEGHPYTDDTEQGKEFILTSPVNYGESNENEEYYSAYENTQNKYANKLLITDEQILKNIQRIQERNEIDIIDEINNYDENNKTLNLTIEMETGTGKTYVYLKTIYELNKKYGWKKFVIVVPSIAIREGVLKNLQITQSHFNKLYNNTPVHYFTYSGKNINKLRDFAESNVIQVLIINTDSFDKKEFNIIHRNNDRLSGQQPIRFIQRARPIVIMDEPQNMDTDKKRDAIAGLNPLFNLRYSATHKHTYNLIYRLDPIDAYTQGLVKRIEVKSVITKNDYNNPYIKLKKIKQNANSVTATVEIDVFENKVSRKRYLDNQDKLDKIQRKSISVKCGDNLYDKSGKRDVYNNHIINEINAADEFIKLSNGKKIKLGQKSGGLTDEIMRRQIAETVQEHFIKEVKNHKDGIKTISLFFIDRVENYRDNERNPGKFSNWFEEEFNRCRLKEEFRDLDISKYYANQVHDGYFSQDNKNNYKNSTGKSKEDKKTFDLIMKNKERLLSQDESTQFIFTHSALKEGWDNPNVFQICTLNETKSEMKKRQEIGRGLRIAVNQNGIKVDKDTTNILTIVANENYEDFCNKLQSEINEECGIEVIDKNYIKDRNKRREVIYNKDIVTNEQNEHNKEFLKLWSKIKHKTIYKVDYETKELVKIAAERINNMERITPAQIEVRTSRIGMNKIIGPYTEKSSMKVKDIDNYRNIIFIPNVIKYIQNQGKIRLTKQTIFDILVKSGRIRDLLINPQTFINNVIDEIKSSLDKLMISGIVYTRNNESYELSLFNNYYFHENKFTFDVDVKTKTTNYNSIPLDSGVEYDFAQELEYRDDIEFYIKLPKMFRIKTPIGSYNPDWAIIKKNNTEVYFIAETKGNDPLRTSEYQKMDCGIKHCDALEDVKFKRVGNQVNELDNYNPDDNFNNYY